MKVRELIKQLADQNGDDNVLIEVGASKIQIERMQAGNMKTVYLILDNKSTLPREQPEYETDENATGLLEPRLSNDTVNNENLKVI